MLKVIFAASRIASQTSSLVQNVARNQALIRNFSILQQTPIKLLGSPKIEEVQSRSVTKFSYRKGKRKTVRVVLQKFYRLYWGGWIRTICGRNKKLWKKSPPRKRRLRQHVLCNATQSNLLDKMVGHFWTKRRYYVDDPYEPYHTREEFRFTYKKPKPYFPPE